MLISWMLSWEIYITILCLNGTLSCVDFMDVTMGDIYNHTVFEWDTVLISWMLPWEIYITILCLDGTLLCVDFVDVTMGDIHNHTVFGWDTFMC